MRKDCGLILTQTLSRKRELGRGLTCTSSTTSLRTLMDKRSRLRFSLSRQIFRACGSFTEPGFVDAGTGGRSLNLVNYGVLKEYLWQPEIARGNRVSSEARDFLYAEARSQ